MQHGHNGLLAINPWMTGVIIFICLIAGATVIWLIHRKRVASDGLTPMERKELGYPERDILAMLRQHGGPMKQSDLIDSIPGDLEGLAKVLNTMEANKLVQRTWLPDQATYVVTA